MMFAFVFGPEPFLDRDQSYNVIDRRSQPKISKKIHEQDQRDKQKTRPFDRVFRKIVGLSGQLSEPNRLRGTAGPAQS